MSSERLAAVFPVYNEQTVIGHVLEDWCKTFESLGVDFELHVYDDGSLDNSLMMMQQASNRHNGRIVVHEKMNSGHGPTVLLGYLEAVANGFDWIFQVDSDNEIGPENFVKLWECRGEYDFIVGRRTGRLQSVIRCFVSTISRLTVRVFYGKSQIWDVNSPYRLMRAVVFEKLFETLPVDTFAPNVILTGLAAKHGLRCLELPVKLNGCRTGKTSLGGWKLLRSTLQSFGETAYLGLESGIGNGLAIFIALLATLICITRTGGFMEFFGQACVFSKAVDSNIFKIIGKMMCNGGMPFRDVFDHKGPLFFLIQWLAFRVGQWHGVIFPEFLAYFFSCLILLKSMLCLARPTISLLGVAVFVWLTPNYLGEGYGNLPEVYALPFVICGLYCLVRLTQSGKLGKWRSMLLGICTAVVLLMKLNLIGVFLVTGLILFGRLVFQRPFIPVLQDILFALLGFWFICVPILLWLYFNSSLVHCYNDYILFNLHYSNIADESILSGIQNVEWRIRQYYWKLLLPAFQTFLAMTSKKKCYCFYACYFCLIVNCVLLMSTTFCFRHYLTVLVPCCIILFAIALDNITMPPCTFLYSFCALLILSFHLAHVSIQTAMYNEQEASAQIMAVRDEIVLQKVVKNGGKLLVLTGNADTGRWYRLYDALPDGRQMYLPPVISANIDKDLISHIVAKRSRLILVVKDKNIVSGPTHIARRQHYEDVILKHYHGVNVKSGVLYEADPQLN